MANAHHVRVRAPEAELVVFADGRAIVRGTADAARARAVLARYVGV
jgi:TATA-box binding protein (TBP) (component of TFIID and TFIIIB)